MGRFRLYGAEGQASGGGPGSEGFHERQRLSVSQIDRRGPCQEPDEVSGSGEGRTSVWHHQTAVRIYQGALPRSGEECATVVRSLCAEQLGDGEETPTETATSQTAAKLRLNYGRSDKTDEIRRTTITKMDNSCRPGNIQLKIWMRRVKNS